MEKQTIIAIIITLIVIAGVIAIEITKEANRDYSLKSSKHIDYGESKILLDTDKDDTLFTIESRLIYDGQELYLTSDMPLEHTFSKDDLFQKSTFKINFIFLNDSNRFLNLRSNYYKLGINEVNEDLEVIKLIKESDYEIIEFDEVRDYMDKMYSFVGITIYYIEDKKVILEYPIKTINWLDKGKIFQSDTGKIVFINPKTKGIDLGYIITNSFNNTELKLDYQDKDIYKIKARNYVGVKEIK